MMLECEFYTSTSSSILEMKNNHNYLDQLMKFDKK
jgi:hypothetical protein